MAASIRTGLKGFVVASRCLFTSHLPTKCMPKSYQAGFVNCKKFYGTTPLMSQVNCLSSTSRVSSVISSSPLLATGKLCQPSSPLLSQNRSKIRYSFKQGKAKAVRAVTGRFYRLDWGIWIRTRAGRHKKLWRKHAGKRYRYKQHVFCNKQQSKLFDKMTKTYSDYWKRKRHYPDDPYNAYQKRSNFPQYFVDKPKFIP